jgi:2-oxoglutarate ferredoxin oxidoreductase subunit beta
MRTKSSPQGSIDHPIDPISFALGCGATFVARGIDVDAPHMQDVLRRAHAHKGTSFIEILQNCPVFNDGAWGELEDRKTRAETALVLEHGKPLVFGSPGNMKGVVLDHGVPSIIDLADSDDPAERGVVVHDETHENTSYAYALATLKRPDFPLPVGIIREVVKPTYETMLQDQVSAAIDARGVGDLGALLNSGDTWEVS